MSDLDNRCERCGQVYACGPNCPSRVPVSRDTPRPEGGPMCPCGEPDCDGCDDLQGERDVRAPTAPRERETPNLEVPSHLLTPPESYTAADMRGEDRSPASVPPVAEARLDFAQAYERAFGWPMKSDLDLGDLRYHDHLNSQVRAIVAKVRAERDREHQTLIAAVLTPLQPLIRWCARRLP